MSKKTTVHIEGMGIPGCLLALYLQSKGIPFTWHDTGMKQVAWQASTGAIYPANSKKFGDDWYCYQAWLDMFDTWAKGDWLEKANYFFNHKSCAPHDGKYPVGAPTEHGLRGPLNSTDIPSVHLNAQVLVPYVRNLFAEHEVPGDKGYFDTDYLRKNNTHYIVTHGWSKRHSHTYWGWTRLVTLKYPKRIYGKNKNRPAFYFREGRFTMTYAYPVPGTNFWYSGSSIIKQRAGAQKSLAMEPKYEKWQANFERLSGGAVTVKSRGPFIEGWRPCALPSKDWLETEGNVTYLKPLWNSGIRHFPMQILELNKVIQLA